MTVTAAIDAQSFGGFLKRLYECGLFESFPFFYLV